MPGRVLHIAWWQQSGWRIVAATLIAGSLVVAGLAIRIHDTQQLNSRICERINVLDTAILTVLNRSYKSLSANGYYRAHPQQLQIALANTIYAINLVKSARC